MEKLYKDCVKDILENPQYQKMAGYIQHGTTTTLDHCEMVSRLSFQIARFFHLDYRCAARAGLLHDLFLYDWHDCFSRTGNHFHGLTHPQIAARNADRYFDLTERELDCIRCHMWPLTLKPPKSLEGVVILMADKICGTRETVETRKKKIQKWLEHS